MVEVVKAAAATAALPSWTEKLLNKAPFRAVKHETGLFFCENGGSRSESTLFWDFLLGCENNFKRLDVVPGWKNLGFLPKRWSFIHFLPRKVHKASLSKYTRTLGEPLMRRILATILVSIAGAMVLSAAANPAQNFQDSEAACYSQEKEKAKVNSGKIRHGKLADVNLEKDKIAVINSKKIYLEIPAYKAIVKDKVKKGTARYIKLMEEATALYRATLEKVANKKSIKLIVEVGGVSGVKTTDLTDAIIAAL